MTPTLEHERLAAAVERRYFTPCLPETIAEIEAEGDPYDVLPGLRRLADWLAVLDELAADIAAQTEE